MFTESTPNKKFQNDEVIYKGDEYFDIIFPFNGRLDKYTNI